MKPNKSSQLEHDNGELGVCSPVDSRCMYCMRTLTSDSRINSMDQCITK